MTKCPPVERADFQRMRNTSDEQVAKQFGRWVSKLHLFLNTTSVVHDLQSDRSAWTSPRDRDAFRNFKAESGHWYTFNHGGRNEAQMNVGMFPDRLRIGMGFEFTEKEHGDPKRVRFAFSRFLQAVGDNGDSFRKLIRDLPLEMELFPARGGRLEVFQPESLLEVLLDLPREPLWIFVGRMLRPDVDDEVLSNGDRLGGEVDRVFVQLRPWWKRANGALRS